MLTKWFYHINGGRCIRPSLSNDEVAANVIDLGEYIRRLSLWIEKTLQLRPELFDHGKAFVRSEKLP